MNTLETLLDRRWILKSRDRDLYYQVKDDLGGIRKFVTEKLGYPLIVNPYLVKLEKLPAKPENWMGILEFEDKTEYIFFCLILMFLEESEEQFLLSTLTEYIQSNDRKEAVDWTIYSMRRHLIRVIKYCISCGILKQSDGNEENFARDEGSEVLYENPGVSRYFMKNFTQDIMTYQSPEDFLKEEWIGVDEDRGIVRRQRVYRQLLMTPGLYRDGENEEDFAYLRNQRNLIASDMEEFFDCELQVHKNSAFLVLGEECHMGRTFPEENTLSDIALLFAGILREQIEAERIVVPVSEQIILPREQFLMILEECRHRCGAGFPKKYRELTTGEFCREVMEYMEQIEWIKKDGNEIKIRSIAGKITGRYPKDFNGEEGGKREQQMAD